MSNPFILKKKMTKKINKMIYKTLIEVLSIYKTEEYKQGV